MTQSHHMCGRVASHVCVWGGGGTALITAPHLRLGDITCVDESRRMCVCVCVWVLHSFWRQMDMRHETWHMCLVACASHGMSCCMCVTCQIACVLHVWSHVRHTSCLVACAWHVKSHVRDMSSPVSPAHVSPTWERHDTTFSTNENDKTWQTIFPYAYRLRMMSRSNTVWRRHQSDTTRLLVQMRTTRHDRRSIRMRIDLKW